MKFALQAFISCAAAFPFVADNLDSRSDSESNCGPIPCTTFNAKEQYVDVSSATRHQFIAPTHDDRRGPCPGLKLVRILVNRQRIHR